MSDFLKLISSLSLFVCGVISDVAYKLDLTPHAHIHLVFHISKLKKVIGLKMASQSLPASLTNDMEPLLLQMDSVLETQQNLQGVIKVLICWKYMLTWESTLADFDVIDKQFPTFHFEDNVALLGRR